MIYLILIIIGSTLILCYQIKTDITMKVFIINGGQVFGHSGGRFNATVTKETISFFSQQDGVEVQTTNINDVYDPAEEVKKYVWADLIIYHTPIWWFSCLTGLRSISTWFLVLGTGMGFTEVTAGQMKIRQ